MLSQAQTTWTEMNKKTADFYIHHDYENALSSAKEMLDFAVKNDTNKPPMRHFYVTRSLDTLGLIYFQKSDYNKAIDSFKRAIEIERGQSRYTNKETIDMVINLANSYEKLGKYDRAEDQYKEAIRTFSHNNFIVANYINMLGSLHVKQGDYISAESLYINSLRKLQAIYGIDNPMTINSLIGLGSLYKAKKDYYSSSGYYKQALKILSKPGNHISNAQAVLIFNGLAYLYKIDKNYNFAEELYAEVLRVNRSIYGENHPNTAKSINNLASLYKAKGDYRKAIKLYKQAADINIKIFGEKSPKVAINMNNLASVYFEMGQYNKSEKLFKQSLSIREQTLGENHPKVATSLLNLAHLYRKTNRESAAIKLEERALSIRQKAKQYQ